MTMTMTPPVRKPDDPTVHLKEQSGAEEALCGRQPDGINDILVDTLDDDPVVDCDVCREMAGDSDVLYDYGDEADDPFDFEED